jgi:hypothetical protein
MTETTLFRTLHFVNWYLFAIWCLGFGAYPKYVVYRKFPASNLYSLFFLLSLLL